MRKMFMFLLILLFSSFLISSNALSYPVPGDGQSYEMDVVGYTGLYRDGEILETGSFPDIGDESRSFLRISNIHTLDEYWGGIKDKTIFTSDNDTVNLFVIQKGLFIDKIHDYNVDDPKSRVDIFFNSNGYTDYQFEAYLDTSMDWPGDIRGGGEEPDWDNLYDTVSANDLLWAGWFTESTYVREWGSYNALVGITLDPNLLTGDWLENNEIYTDPAGDPLNPQAWIDLDPQYAFPWIQDLWGPGKDLAIGNLSLDAAGSRGWTAYADDWTRGATVPEPTTLILLGTGLLGLAAFGRKRLRITK